MTLLQTTQGVAGAGGIRPGETFTECALPSVHPSTPTTPGFCTLIKDVP